jgi:Hydrazine synthase alpha subunit middle domain
MKRLLALAMLSISSISLAQDREPLFTSPINVIVPHISTDKSVTYDYDIIYVRADRAGDEKHKRFFTDFSQPVTMEPGADLVLLHPDGAEEVLVDGGQGSVTDPIISFDGQWVYYSYLYDLRNHSQWEPPAAGADIFKLNLKTREIVKLTTQKFTPNTGAAPWSSDYRKGEEGKTNYNYGVFNLGPCPLPDGKIAFTSNRDGFRPPKGYPVISLQLFVMNDDGSNIEKIGHLNVAGALHPVVLKDGRIMFSTLESQGIRSEISWGIWTIHPDGTNWNPLVSAFDPGGASNGFHFQTQLSDGQIIVEEYYNQNNSGFGAYIKLPTTQPEGYPAFGPGYMPDERNQPWRFGRFDNGKGKWYRMPFMPSGSVSFTPFSLNQEGPADHAVLGDKNSPCVGKFTHPSGAPDNHLLTCYSPGPVNHQYTFLPQLDGGIYLAKGGQVIEQPGDMLLIKNDPTYNECWPRAVVPYERIYGIKAPKRLEPLANDGSLSPHLPAGTPFGLVGTSSFYKRESYPNGRVPQGKVTAEFAGGRDEWKSLDPFTSHGNGMPVAWHNQGGDVGLYTNDDIHAVRILAMEPTTDRQRGAHSGRRFYSHARERLRILGEIPLRKFSGEHQPLDPDGNPDTSFLAKIPADTAFTFQTLDKRGLMLNFAQTWHQLRPGEVRTNCGGCHAHSQKPTHFALTAAAKPDYKVWDLVNETPLIMAKASARREPPDSAAQSTRVQVRYDAADSTTLRFLDHGPANVEYHRDIVPILKQSCIACHSSADGKEPAAKLDLAADATPVQAEQWGKFPGTYYRLALDQRAQFGHKPVRYDSWGYPQASRYIRKFQARRSLFVWKILGERLDGFSNDDHPSESKPGAGDVVFNGETLDPDRHASRMDIDFTGSAMPPPEAVKEGKVQALSDEDRRTICRWIDLGCPIDLDFDPQHPEYRGYGWMLDDNRPILALTLPREHQTEPLDRILIGMHDYYTGLDPASFIVLADFEVNGVRSTKNLAQEFNEVSPGVWELKLRPPLSNLPDSRIAVSIKDKQGNTTSIERTFRVD